MWCFCYKSIIILSWSVSESRFFPCFFPLPHISSVFFPSCFCLCVCLCLSLGLALHCWMIASPASHPPTSSAAYINPGYSVTSCQIVLASNAVHFWLYSQLLSMLLFSVFPHHVTLCSLCFPRVPGPPLKLSVWSASAHFLLHPAPTASLIAH